MRKDTLNKLGLAAVILLAPGGFILGATLVANHYRKKSQRSSQPAADDAEADLPDRGE
ncbi:MAG: hypothetical protein JWM38_395 [Sphingomonas bacterium]|nr:hypothetical protein [Sphingomonas bacterium]